MASTPTWTEALYHRVVTRLPPPEVHAASNRVLEEEFSSLHRALDDVLAAFAKLQEVRDAVSKLEQGSSSTGGRSVSLLAVLGNVEILQRKLDKKVENMTVNGTVNRLEKKRKARNESDQKSKRTKCKPEDKSASTTRPVAASKESSSESDSDSESASEQGDESEIDGSEAALKSLKTLEARDSQRAKGNLLQDLKHAAKDDSGESGPTCSFLSAANLKSILKEVDKLPREDRILIMPEILAALRETMIADVSGRQAREVIDSLQFVIRWACKPAGQSKLFALYSDYAEVVEEYANEFPASAQRIDLKRLSNDLHGVFQNLKAFTSADTVVQQWKGGCHAFVKLVTKIDKMALCNHEEHVLQMLVAFKKSTAVLNHNALKRALTSMNAVARWIRDAPREPYLLCKYWLLVQAMHEMMFRIRRQFVKDGYISLTNRMSEMLTDTSTAKAQEYLATVRGRAEKLLAEIDAWKNSSPSLHEISLKLNALASVVNHASRGWAPRQEPAILSCEKIFSRHFKRTEAEADRRRFSERLAKIMDQQRPK